MFFDSGADDSCSWSSVLCVGKPITTKERAISFLKEIKPDHNFEYIRTVKDVETSGPYFEFECSKCCVTVSVGTEYSNPHYHMTVMSHPDFEASCAALVMDEACS